MKLGSKVFCTERIRYTGLYRRLGFWHCRPNGGPVLLSETGWKTVSGVYLRLGQRLFSFQWKRFSR
jgi:hypothetical protein